MTRDIIVVGASAGGLEALRTICASLPTDLPAAILVVQHIAPTARSLLPELLSRAGPVPALAGQDGLAVQPGRIYVAPPDQHMLLDGHGRLMLRRGPYENRTRPAVDVLFRSAAAAAGSRCIGVVLSGLLDDGTAGLIAIKRCGGLSVVQDPADATWPDMPRNALIGDSVDHSAAAADLPALLSRLAREPAGPTLPVPPELLTEIYISTREVPEMGEDAPIVGRPSPLSCPDCGGVLNELRDGKVIRFRCQIGHAYASETLAAAQRDVLQEALASALRAHRERLVLFRRMHENAVERGHSHAAERWERAAREAERAAEVISAALVGMRLPDAILRE
jgi:two-component system chemotaxis response regulator CheB